MKLHRIIRDRILAHDFESACEALCLLEMVKS